jgi:hypothetical protein
MESPIFNINYFGVVVYSFYVITILWILLKKDFKFISIIFPLFALTEGLFIDWRWDKLQDYNGNIQLLLGALPSLIIGIGFPFIGFYLHHFMPKNLRNYSNKRDLFPFSDEDFSTSDFSGYYKRGLIYSFSTLILHELTQVFNISSRNTYDLFDLIAITIGSLFSLGVYMVFKTVYHKNESKQDQSLR